MSLSPMMSHYLKLKEQYKDTILLYRLGDFYELFFEDAEICSRVLGLTLTGKDCGLAERAPMCGVPQKAIDIYIAKLLNANYKIAICEQLTDKPTAGQKIVDRDVIRIVTPGTVVDSALLDETTNSYIASIYKNKNLIGASYLDISTGDFYLTEFNDNDFLSKINDFLAMVQPKEVICNKEMFELREELMCFKNHSLINFNLENEENFNLENAVYLLKKQLHIESFKGFDCANKYNALCSAGAVISFVLETQKRDLSYINKLQYFSLSEYMQIDAQTRRNLELVETMRDRKKYGTLLWLLDKTKTSMGARELKNMVEKPLINDKLINERLDAVEELAKNIIDRDELRNALYKIYDIERLAGKIGYGNLNPKDCISLKNSLLILPEIFNRLNNFSSNLFMDIKSNIYDFSLIAEMLDKSIDENASSSTKDGGFIRLGYNKELDDYLNISKTGKNWIMELETKEKQDTGIKNLKIKYNKVFGYFIEVTNSQKDLVPYRYTRKQTIANAERFITDELKQIEDKILNAEDMKIVLEMQIFNEIREKLLVYVEKLQKTSKAIAQLDALLSLAIVAVENNYHRPIINKKINSIEIIDGRHPVVEKINSEEEFVPNDTNLNDSDSRTMIITGPNMSGKSTYMRQVAIITLLAHIGSFVPAKSAKISITDQIFTRIGASDDLAVGQSTFMVEMLEVANILRNATNSSLIILDEVGRGTSTFDGLSIAWSVMEYLSKTLCCKTLFATHFHELTDLEGTLEGVKNYRVTIKEFNNSIIFLRKIIRGGTNKSFGIEVASLAKLPPEIINRARVILHNLEQSDLNRNNDLINETYNDTENILQNKQRNEVIRILNEIDINTLTPLNAFDILIQLKNDLKKD